jgi:pre-rRNA-processing protein TSR4
MAPYDSDSSDEGEEYTETNVLLGYASKEASGDVVSHLGGHPVGSPSRPATMATC